MFRQFVPGLFHKGTDVRNIRFARNRSGDIVHPMKDELVAVIILRLE